MIEVIGTDAGAPATLPAPQRERMLQASLVAAPQRLHAALKEAFGAALPPLLATDALDACLEVLQRCGPDQSVVLLASGDPLWFGIGRQLLQRLNPDQLRFHPAPSSLQLAFARIGRPWQDASWISLHGRDSEPLATALQRRPPALAVLTDPGRGGAEAVLILLRASGLQQAYGVWLCEKLGHPEERVRRLDPELPLGELGDPLQLVLLIAEPPAPPANPEDMPLFGLADGLWLQHADRPGLMTKREVRVQLLADLELPARGVLWDLGAGVGSIGLEALRLRPSLELWALERRGGSAALIAANAERLGVRPASIQEGQAPEALSGFPDPDRVVIGGGRERQAVLQAVLARLRPGGLVVIPLATLEALAELKAPLEASGLRISVSQHQSWRGAPLADGTRLAPMNPVLVLKGKRY
ncbi:MAG TPA: bifunctional cobalt-precorrin-7 (C(5))-methyltransferase/cobalt-precorrin-6B (C(15))-methyltransferase [Synechococcales bacterium UBA10510]|nr:bifunctional cobalt-precorrin-7 (C(5))-methyltransferase/cobalt-precorrin-6B (C(15))-methyltransferase [Synechococcales bacterium UBA10510]